MGVADGFGDGFFTDRDGGDGIGRFRDGDGQGFGGEVAPGGGDVGGADGEAGDEAVVIDGRDGFVRGLPFEDRFGDADAFEVGFDLDGRGGAFGDVEGGLLGA